MVTLYLIGPSQVGKSTAARALARSGVINHVDLDAVIKQQHPEREPIQVIQDWAIVEPILEFHDVQATNPLTLLDIGAGTQDSDRHHHDRKVENWLSGRTERVILISGSHDELLARNSALRDDPALFDLIEWGERLRIYASAGHSFSSIGMNPNEVAQRLAGVIHSIVEPS